MNNLLKNLRTLSAEVKFDTSRKDKVESLLLSRITETGGEKTPFFIRLADYFVPANFALQPAAVFSLVLGLFLIFSFASANASRNALPGDTLYPVKITAENIKYTLAFSQTNKVKYAMTILENRVAELESIVKSGNGERQVRMAATTKKIKEGLNLVNNKIEDIGKTEEPVKAIAAVKEIDIKLSELKNKVVEVSNVSENDSEIELAAVMEEVDKTNSLVKAALIDLENKIENIEEEGVVKGEEVVGSEEEKISTSTSSSTVQAENFETILNTTSQSILPEVIYKEMTEKNQEIKEFGVEIGK